MGTERVTLAVGGMTCRHCVAAVQRALASVPGVQEVEVTLEPPRASVSYDASLATVEALRKATDEEGYPSAPASAG